LGLLLAAAVLLIVRFQKSQSSRPALGAGLFLGMAALVNQIVILLPLVLLPFIVATAAHKARALALFALTPLVMLAVILPWTVRNYQVAGTIIPVHSGGITQFLKGSLEFENYHRAPLRLMELERMGREEMAKLLGLDVAAFDERTPGVDEALLPFALAYVREHPERLVAKLAAQAPRFWYLSESPLKSRFLAVVQGVSLLLALVGTLAGLRRRNWSVLTLLLVIVYFNLVYAITHAQARYSTPLAPLVCVLAAAGLSLILTMSTRYRRPPSASEPRQDLSTNLSCRAGATAHENVAGSVGPLRGASQRPARALFSGQSHGNLARSETEPSHEVLF
jgi:4-amino-4-deoxy-L-arabinose transferase-like glycosyltransferase